MFKNTRAQAFKDGESTKKSRGILKKAKRFILTWSAREMALVEHAKQNFLVQEHDVKEIEYLCLFFNLRRHVVIN